MKQLLTAKIFHIGVACTDAGEGRAQDAAGFAKLGGSATIVSVSRPVIRPYMETEGFNP